MVTLARNGLALFTDLYELTMMQAYMAEGMSDTAVFTMFVRRLPDRRNFLLACGIDDALACLEALTFSDGDIAYLRSLGMFSDSFLNWLHTFRFTGDVHAVPEGTPIFAAEPMLEVVAPIAEAQLIETLLMNQVHVQTLLASKAARVVLAAQGRRVIDFGGRRAHGIDAAIDGARAFYVAGVHGTSNVLAGRLHAIPVAGTMAHSYIQAHDDERQAFSAFASAFPGTVVLVDTYDTLEGVRRLIPLIRKAEGGLDVSAVRLDSGDLDTLARETRRLLDQAGLQHVGIVASGSLDEYAIATLLAAGAPISGFGVGTNMAVSADVPSLDIVYKLSEYRGIGRTKLSPHKGILPGRKQVFRREEGGRATGDVIAGVAEHIDGRPLLEPAMRGGRMVSGFGGNLNAARQRAADQIARLPTTLLTHAPANPPFPVSVSDGLERHHTRVRSGVN